MEVAKMFEGFSENTIAYLNNLKSYNNKIWFEETRKDYEKYLLGNFQELVKDLGPLMLEIDPFIDINPKKCISRIYRDVRFSKDKSPYRPNMWISLKRAYKDWKIEPTYYFEIFPDGYRFGMGFYDIPKYSLDKLRDLIEKGDVEFNKMHSLYKSQKLFKLEGNMYKRVLNPNIKEELREWYQKKEIYFVCNRGIDDVLFSRELVNELIEGFKLLSPMYEFFMKLKGHGDIVD
jgi:uncharacterized protein (TIGR02453 family)